MMASRFNLTILQFNLMAEAEHHPCGEEIRILFRLGARRDLLWKFPSG
jgi:hypothetical protein